LLLRSLCALSIVLVIAPSAASRLIPDRRWAHRRRERPAAAINLDWSIVGYGALSTLVSPIAIFVSRNGITRSSGQPWRSSVAGIRHLL
jgi:hypothetical protein